MWRGDEKRGKFDNFYFDKRTTEQRTAKIPIFQEVEVGSCRRHTCGLVYNRLDGAPEEYENCGYSYHMLRPVRIAIGRDGILSHLLICLEFGTRRLVSFPFSQGIIFGAEKKDFGFYSTRLQELKSREISCRLFRRFISFVSNPVLPFRLSYFALACLRFHKFRPFSCLCHGGTKIVV